MDIRPASVPQHRNPDADKRSQAPEPAIPIEGETCSTAANAERIGCTSNRIERLLDEADAQAQTTSARCSHEEVFGSLRRMLPARS